MENKVMNFMVDLDGTLKTDVGLNIEHGETMKVGDKEYFYKERPYVKEFIDGLLELGDVYICTAASQKYAKKFAEKFEIEDKVKKIISRDTIHFVDSRLTNNFVFIDNDLEMAHQKVFIMGKGSMGFGKNQTFITAKTYNGELGDKELMNILKQIKILMS